MSDVITSSADLRMHAITWKGQVRASCALEASGLTLVRGHKVVLRDVHLVVSPGEMCVLQGPNGVGKSTLLHCLAGALRPTQGEVRWFGESASRSCAARRLVGFLGHESGLYVGLTGRENLLFAGRMYGVTSPAERAERLLAAVDMQRYKHQQVGCLSRGQRQRLAIARAVIHDPPILLLDEPFTSLDSQGCDWLEGFLGHLRENGRAILIATHETERTTLDRVLRLSDGRLSSIEGQGTRWSGQSLSRPWRP